nr:unnamed protein product [Digitaria exilis]
MAMAFLRPEQEWTRGGHVAARAGLVPEWTDGRAAGQGLVLAPTPSRAVKHPHMTPHQSLTIRPSLVVPLSHLASRVQTPEAIDRGHRGGHGSGRPRRHTGRSRIIGRDTRDALRPSRRSLVVRSLVWSPRLINGGG